MGSSVGSTNDYNTSVDASGNLILMGNRVGSIMLDGAWGEMIVTTDISSSMRANYESYLSDKWGL